jgi:hypothetical protein
MITVPGAPNFEAPTLIKGEDLNFEYRSFGSERVELFMSDSEFEFRVSCIQDDTGQISVPASVIDFLPAGEIEFRLYANNSRKDVVGTTLFRTVSYSSTFSSTTLVE